MKSSERQLIDLLQQVLVVAREIVTPTARPTTKRQRSSNTGIYPHTSKYNPWRAYVWDTAKRKSVYIGAFPSVSKAKAAQRDYRANRPVASGTKSLRLVS